MLIRFLAVLALLFALWAVFRLAMSLRHAKIAREAARAGEEDRGRRVVAEVPVPTGLEMFLEDDTQFVWAGRAMPKRGILGGRLLLNGGVVATARREGASLPEPPPVPVEEGRARWEVVLYLEAGESESIACGSLGDGVSRDIAGRVFDALRRALSADD